MSLPVISTLPPSRCFPRVSGDEPELAAEAGIKNGFSPRERG